MTVATIDARTPSTPASTTGAAAAWVAAAGAAAFVVAAVWYGLIARSVTVARPPVFDPGAPVDGELHRWFAWLVTTLPQERLDAAVAIAAFLCLVPLAAATRDLLGRDRAPARIAAQAMQAGALLWVTGNVMQLGGRRAVGLMATHGNPIQTVNSILFTLDTIDDTFELAAFAVLGIALLAFAGAAVGRGAGERAAGRAWSGYSALLGAVLLALSGAYAAGNGDLVDLLLVAGGALLLPAWMVWTGRLLRPARAPGIPGRS